MRNANSGWLIEARGRIGWLGSRDWLNVQIINDNHSHFNNIVVLPAVPQTPLAGSPLNNTTKSLQKEMGTGKI